MTRQELIEAVVCAWRERDPFGRIKASPLWHDLDAEGRRLAFDEALLARKLEAAVDPDGLSSTGRAVLGRVTGR